MKTVNTISRDEQERVTTFIKAATEVFTEKRKLQELGFKVEINEGNYHSIESVFGKPTIKVFKEVIILQ